MFKYIFFSLLIVVLIPFEVLSQKNIPMNTWRTHAAYTNAHSVAQTPERVYCASENGFFYIDKDDNSVNELSRLNGLSENEITTISYHSSSQTLIIGYKSGNIDFLKNDVITNIRSVLSANILGSKRLNNILLDGNLAYFSADFGVIVLDISRKEIKETYRRIGAGGIDLKVFQASFFQEGNQRRLFLATSLGVLSGNLANNLQDFNNWRTFGDSDGITSDAPVNHLQSLGNVIYANIITTLPNVGLYKYSGGLWQIVASVPETTFFNIQNINQNNQNKIYVSVPNKIYVFDENVLLNTISDALIINPKSILFDENSKIWLADNKKGLVSNFEGAFKAYIPSGLSTNNTFNISYANSKIFALAGGQKNGISLMREGNLSVFDNGIWKNFAPIISNISVNNISAICYNPFENKYYFASFGGGVITQNASNNAPNTDFTRLNEVGQTFGTTANIADISIDNQGNMFFSEYNAANSFHIRTRVASGAGGNAGTWTSANAPATPENQLTTSTNFQIVRQNNNGLWVYDNSKKNLPRLILPATQEARFSNNILSMAEDKEGVLWLGTDKGVLWITDLSSRVFTNPTPIGSPVLAGKRLLLGENITTIAVDGGNRKWLGTENGVFLVNADGTSIIKNFTFANSPLLSNKILSISINQSNGEVFFATDKGIISYRSDASNKADNALENSSDKVCVFPNPVAPNFSGMIGLECLPENANIKITDISGRLIYETRANGASAAWNGRDYSGRRAATGVYIILATTQDGVESRVGKIAIIE